MRKMINLTILPLHFVHETFSTKAKRVNRIYVYLKSEHRSSSLEFCLLFLEEKRKLDEMRCDVSNLTNLSGLLLVQWDLSWQTDSICDYFICKYNIMAKLSSFTNAEHDITCIIRIPIAFLQN